MNGIPQTRVTYCQQADLKGVIPAFVIGKVIGDFTDCIQLRHPYEIGGLYFSLNFFQPLVGLLLLLSFIDENLLGGRTMAYLKTATLGFGALLIASATLFMLLINQEHRRTFSSVETGARMTQRK